MKRQLLCSFAVLLVALCAVSANAQSIVYPIKVKVPFNFYVENNVLPQGDYTVSTVGPTRMVMLTGPQGSIFLSTTPAENGSAKKADELIFHRVNDQYFLASIWTSDNRLGHELFRSKHEKELVAQAGKPAVKVLLASAR